MKKSFHLYLIILCAVHAYSQSPEWINYTCGKDIGSLAEEGNFFWVGTGGGLG